MMIKKTNNYKKENSFYLTLYTGLIFYLKKFTTSSTIKFDNKVNLYIKNINYVNFVLNFLKKSSFFCFNQLMDYTAIHKFNKNKNFQISIQLLSILLNTRLCVNYNIRENQSIISLLPLFKSCNWLERELFDMFGIFILNHNDLRRILTDYGFKEHPLRKDYPVIGYKEYYYSEIFKSITEMKTKLKYYQKT